MRRFFAHLVCILFSIPFAASAATQSCLVAPFSNRAGDVNLDWIGESIAEAIREALDTGGLDVASRDDREQGARALSLRPSPQLSLASITKLAERIDASRLIYGRFELITTAQPQARSRLRVTARVLDTRQALQLSEFANEAPLEELATLQNDLAWQILRWIQPSVSITRDQFLSRHPPAKVHALEQYVRGLLASTTDQKHRFYTQAARYDPTFAHPCLALGQMHWEKESYREAVGWLEKVPPTHVLFEKAAFLLGLSRYELSDYAGARASFESLARLLPISEVMNNLGASLARLNQKEALDYFRRALEADPTDPDYHFNTGYTLWKRGDYTTAADLFRAALDRVPDDEDSILLLGRCLKQTGPRPGDWRSDGLERLKDTYQVRSAISAATKK